MRKDFIIFGAIIIIVAILLFAVSIPTAIVDNYGTDYGAVLVLNFEEGTGASTFDQSPYGNDGQFSVAPAPIWTTGKYGEALRFTNSYVAVGNVTTSLRTIEFWVYLDTTSEPILELEPGINITAVGGTLTAMGFVGTTTFYVSGAVSSTITAESWLYIALTSDKGESCTALNLGKVGTSYLDGKLDQVRGYTVTKTLGEIRNHYLNSGHMYSGSVVISDDFRILNTTFGERIGLDDSGLDMNHNYILNSDFSHWLHFTVEGGKTDELLNIVGPGILTQDRHFHRITLTVNTAPGGVKEFNVTLSNGVDPTMFIALTGAETSGWTETNEFDWDVSVQTLILTYSQDGGGQVSKAFITIKYHYSETP